jgi:hypothetical protein
VHLWPRTAFCRHRAFKANTPWLNHDPSPQRLRQPDTRYSSHVTYPEYCSMYGRNKTEITFCCHILGSGRSQRRQMQLDEVNRVTCSHRREHLRDCKDRRLRPEKHIERHVQSTQAQSRSTTHLDIPSQPAIIASAKC